MPSSIIHRCVSKMVLEKMNLYENNLDIYMYEIGSIAPDCWRNSKRFKDSLLPKKEKRKYSHFSNDDEYIENYDRFFDKYKDKLNEPFIMGYFVHLITDFHWRTSMFYKCFSLDGSIILLDGSLLNGEKGVRKELLYKESKKMAFLLSNHFSLSQLRQLSMDEINSLPLMNEIEFDGLNDTINFSNIESITDNNHELIVYEVDKFINGVLECSDFIINELNKYLKEK